MMPFRLPKKCRDYFSDITSAQNRSDETKLYTLFDGYYLCALVGLAQAKLNSDPDLDPWAFVDNYPSDYAESGDYIAGLLISAEAKRNNIPANDAEALEKLMTKLVESQSRTRLSPDGEYLLSQYADRGIDVIQEKMVGHHTSLVDFFQDYFECWERGVFFGE